MNNLQFIQNYLKKNIDTADFEVVSKPNTINTVVMFRASIDNASGGNSCTSGWEYSFEDALEELVIEIKKLEKENEE